MWRQTKTHTQRRRVGHPQNREKRRVRLGLRWRCADSSAGDNAFGAREKLRGVQRGGIGDRKIFGATLVGEPRVFGTDRGIVESGGNRMCLGDLAVFGLQNVGVGCPATRRGALR